MSKKCFIKHFIIAFRMNNAFRPTGAPKNSAAIKTFSLEYVCLCLQFVGYFAASRSFRASIPTQLDTQWARDACGKCRHLSENPKKNPPPVLVRFCMVECN